MSTGDSYIDGIVQDVQRRLRGLAGQRDVVAAAAALDEIGVTLAECMESTFAEAELVRIARATDHRSAKHAR